MKTASVRIEGVRYALSQWQPATLRPWEEGVYERQTPAGPYACWTGRAWRRDARTPALAAAQLDASAHPAAPWRGLAEPSGRTCPTCRGHTVVDFGVDAETGEDLLGECPDCD